MLEGQCLLWEINTVANNHVFSAIKTPQSLMTSDISVVKETTNPKSF